MEPDPLYLVISLLTLDITLISGFVILFVLLLCSALISGSEVALFSLTQVEIDEELEDNSKAMEVVSKLLLM